MSTLAASLLTLIMSVPVAPFAPVIADTATPVPYEIAAENWQIQEGDKVIVDTENNEGYIYHTDGQYMNFEVVTGQRRWVYYIGRSYNASTPNWEWTVKSTHHKGDEKTFGKARPSGNFMRLYKDGVTHTAYGFHAYGRNDKEEEEIFSGLDTKFRSMGCIIVRKEIMDLLVNTFEQNESIDVITQYGVDDLQQVMLAFEKDKEDLEESDEVALY